MRNRFVYILLSLLLLVTAPLRAQWGYEDTSSDSWTNTEYHTTEGTEFWVTYMRNSGSSGQDNRDMFLYLYATSRENARVTIEKPNSYETPIQFNVRAGKQDSCLVPNGWAYIEDDKVVSNFAVKVTSDKPIALYATNQHSSGKYDATNVLPTTALMGEYVIQTYRIDQYSTEFALVATRSQDVTINLKKTTIDIQEYETNGRVVVVSDTAETINLHMYAGQTYLYRSASDDGSTSANRATSLSGTTICSDDPLAVFIGGQSAKVPSDPENHIFSQAYPTDKWGKTFYVTPTYGMVYDYVQFSACKNNTQIFKNGTHIATLNARESYIDTVKSVLNYASAVDFINLNVSYTPNVVRYTTSEVAECFLYGTSNTANHPSLEGSELTTTSTNYGAPVLTPIIPQELAMKSTMFATFTKTNTELKHYVNIVTPTAEKSGMRLDGVNISGEFQPIPNSTYSYTIKEVSSGAHKLENVGGRVTSTFTARVYGMGSSSSSKESYAYAVGSRVSRKTDMLIDNQYIKQKTICVTQSIDFTGLIEGDYTSYRWDFKDPEGETQGTGLDQTHRFSSAGDYEVELIVTRPFPYLCPGFGGPGGNVVEDHVKAVIHVKDRYDSNFHKKICQGESVTLRGRDENGNIQEVTYNSDVTEEKHFYTIDGCDSIVHVKIEVGYPETANSTHTACNSYTWHGTTYTESGTYTYVSKTEYNCDRTEILDLTILKPVKGPPTYLTICANSTYPWNGQNITKAGTYTATLTGSNGCDSIATLEVSVEAEYKEEVPVKICHGESYSWRGRTLTEADTYTDHALSPNGCDSTFIVHLSFYPDYSNVRIAAHICEGESYRFGTQTLTESGSYTLEKTSVEGCDSIVHLTLTVHPVYLDTVLVTECQTSKENYSWKVTESFIWDEQRNKRISPRMIPLDKPGEFFYTDSAKTKTCNECIGGAGCDSIQVLRLTVLPVSRNEIFPQVCKEELPYKADPNGKEVNEGGTYTDTLTNWLGCDSILTVHLSVQPEIRDTIHGFRCDNDAPYTYSDDPDLVRFVNLTEGGYYYDTLVTATGCKRYIVLDLKVGQTYHTVQKDTICANGELMYEGTVYKDLPARPAPYEYEISLHTADGCDSIVQFQLTVLPVYEEPVVKDTLCETDADWSWHLSDSHGAYTVPFVKRDLQQRLKDTTMTYTLHTYGSKQCDSIVHLHRVIKPILRDTVYLSLCPEKTPYPYGTHGKTASSTAVYRDTTTSVLYGCDSITVYDITVSDEVRTVIDTYVCKNNLPYNHPTENNRLSGLTQTNVYYDTIRHANACDSILELHLEVRLHSENDTTIYICSGTPYDDPDTHESHYADTTYVKVLTNAVQCDSIVTTHVLVCDTYDMPEEEQVICETEADWSWHVSDSYGSYIVSVPVHDLHQALFDTTLRYTLHTACPARCDSVVHRHLQVKPVLRDTIHPVVCNEQLPFQSNPQGKAVYVSSVYNDTLTSKQYGCDSILTVDLTVLDKITTPVYVELCDNELPYNHPTENNRLSNLTTTGIYNDTVVSQLTGCDSIIELHFQVWSTYEHDQYDTICDNEKFDFHGHVFEHLTARTAPYTFDSLLYSVHGCDSLIHFYLTVHPTYAYLQDTMVCQDTVHTQWKWTDEFGGDHSNINISIAKAGDFVYADTLPTVHGCDSVFGIRVRVAPIYRFDTLIYLCGDDRTEWQGRGYAGNEYGWGYVRLKGDRDDNHRDSVYHHYLPTDSILAPGVYYDTARYYTTAYGCDSTYYLKLVVTPAGHFIRDEVACDNERYHVFYTEDANGQHTDTVFFSPSTRMLDETRRDTLYREAERRLTAVNGGCDSTVHFHLTIHPAYQYVTTAKICLGETYEWRNRTFTSTGVYYDSITTDYWHCDSVYVLELYVKPLTLVPIYDTICDNETYQHLDTLWYTSGAHSFMETTVWTPGMTIPQTYTDVYFKGLDGCDSIIYRYWLQINKTYQFEETAEICSNDQYVMEDGYVFTGHETEYDVGMSVAPLDTTFTHIYQTVLGCDSTYTLHATVYPAYRHRDTIYICDDGEATWREKTYRGNMYGNTLGDGYAAGEHVMRDSSFTHWGCDSIYELHLMVQPTYLMEENYAKCADEDMTWHGINMDHLAVGTYFFFDSLTTTTFGCDSVYHLYLTVNDTTREVLYDTICYPEIYDFHGKPLTEAGYYYDTTLNEWNCHHFTHLYLEYILPTVPTAWADSICADDKAYELHYTYTGDHDPIAFSLQYDEEGHYYGFEDIVDRPITTPEELHTLIIDMPLRDGQRENYPKPNYYNIKLILDNGICRDPDLCSTDTSIVLSYPSWITQQRFGDVIALYNEKYNGGYYWSHYQWYHGDTLLVGETHEYLYVPTGLIVGDQYHVRLTREGEIQDFQTCPITIVQDPIVNDFAPTMGYLSVVPTCIDVDNPRAYILSRKGGTYTIFGAKGGLVARGTFEADVTEVEMPAVEGLYVFILESPDTLEEPYRNIKVLIRKECPAYEKSYY